MARAGRRHSQGQQRRRGLRTPQGPGRRSRRLARIGSTTTNEIACSDASMRPALAAPLLQFSHKRQDRPRPMGCRCTDDRSFVLSVNVLRYSKCPIHVSHVVKVSDGSQSQGTGEEGRPPPVPLANTPVDGRQDRDNRRVVALQPLRECIAARLRGPRSESGTPGWCQGGAWALEVRGSRGPRTD